MSKKEKKSQQISSEEDYAHKIYNEIGKNIFSFLEKKKYLDNPEYLLASCYSMVSLAAELMSETTDMQPAVILKELSSVLSDTLGYEVQYHIDEDSLEEEESQDITALPSITNNKKMLN